MNELAGSESEALIAGILLLKTRVILQYEYFSKQARKDGFEQIAAIFLETADQMKSHAKTLIRLLENSHAEGTAKTAMAPLSATAGNLKEAIVLETRFITLLKEAENLSQGEGFKRSSTKLKLFAQVSEFYLSRFTRLSENIENGTVFKKDHKVKWICRKCGLIYESDKALHNCPGCEHPQAYFEVLAENY